MCAGKMILIQRLKFLSRFIGYFSYSLINADIECDQFLSSVRTESNKKTIRDTCIRTRDLLSKMRSRNFEGKERGCPPDIESHERKRVMRTYAGVI